MKTLVLAGAGHSHLFVLEKWKKAPLADTQLIVLNDRETAAYSGMFPGLLVGNYNAREIYFDIRALCRSIDAEFRDCKVTRISAHENVIFDSHDRRLSFDLLSINLGATTKFLIATENPTVPVFPVKPLFDFHRAWSHFLKTMKGHETIALIGGGAAGCELAFVIQHLICTQQIKANRVILFHSGEHLIPGWTPSASAKICELLSKAGVTVELNKKIERLKERTLFVGSQAWDVDAVLLTSGSKPFLEVQLQGFHNAEDGSILIDKYLNAVGFKHIFAAGDCAEMVSQRREKSGVYAVRAGPLLAENLWRSRTGESLVSFTPQANFLQLLLTGSQSAFLYKAGWSFHGRWVKALKHKIDKDFMLRFQSLESGK